MKYLPLLALVAWLMAITAQAQSPASTPEPSPAPTPAPVVDPPLDTATSAAMPAKNEDTPRLSDFNSIRQTGSRIRQRDAKTACNGQPGRSYLLLTFYNALGVRYVSKPVPYPRIALTSFIAYAFGHNLSLAAFTGTVVRYRIYSTQGLTAIDVATIASFCALTTALGLGVLGGVAALYAVPGTTALHLGHIWSQLFGLLLLGLVATYVAWASLARRPLAIGAWEVRPPGAPLAGAQFVVGVADLSASAAVLWALLPQAAAIDFPTFAGIYAIAVVGGVVSQVRIDSAVLSVGPGRLADEFAQTTELDHLVKWMIRQRK